AHGAVPQLLGGLGDAGGDLLLDRLGAFQCAVGDLLVVLGTVVGGHTGEVVTPIRAVHHAPAHGRDLADLQSREVLIVDVALLGCGRLHEVGDLVLVAGPAGVDGLGDTTGHRVAG